MCNVEEMLIAEFPFFTRRQQHFIGKTKFFFSFGFTEHFAPLDYLGLFALVLISPLKLTRNLHHVMYISW